MSTRPDDPAQPAALMSAPSSQRWLALLALAYTVFYVFGSWVPLQWSLQPIGPAWQTFVASPMQPWHVDERVDIAVNTLLLAPLAFVLLHLALQGLRQPAWQWTAALLIWPLLAGLAVGVEFMQSFLPRSPSWRDVAAQCVGAALGMLLYGPGRRRFQSLLAGLERRSPAHARMRSWLGFYLLLLLVFNVMPLDLSLSPVELYRKWRDGRVLLLPFSAAWSSAEQAAWDLFSDTVLWIPAGVLWRLQQPGSALGAIVVRGLAAAALVEAAQLLVLSRVSDTTDVLLAGCGVAIGAAAPLLWARAAGWSSRRKARAAALAFMAWAALATVLKWAPFDFDAARLASGAAAAAGAAFLRLPFYAYAAGGEFAALSEITRKLLLFLPGGLLLGAWASWRRPPAAAALCTLGLAAMAFGLELGQLLLPSKIADVTDAVLGSIGAAVGLSIARHLGAMEGGAAAVAPSPLSPPPLPSVPKRVPQAGPRPAGRGLALRVVAPVLGVAALVWLAARLPGVPYNVAKLVPASPAGVVSACGTAFALWWLLASPMWLLPTERRRWRLALPLLLPLHALVAFAVLRAAVPLPMLHKIVGSPVLGWRPGVEDLVRYTALHVAVLLPLVGAVLAVRMLQRPAAVIDVLWWAFVALVLAWPLHWVVVEQAGGDNLVELMRGGGSFASGLALATGWGLLALAGSACGAAWRGPRRARLLLVAAAAAALAPLLFQAGLEPLLIKYGRAFSALQFIVSVGRDAYAEGPALAWRAGLAMGVIVAVTAVLQTPLWTLAGPVGQRSRRRRSTRSNALTAA